MVADGAILLVIGVVFLATLIRSSFGFGDALVAVPLLAFLMPVTVATPLAVLLSISISVVVVVQDWHNIHLRSVWRLLLSTLFGIPIGLLLLSKVEEHVVMMILAAAIIAFSTYCLFCRRQIELKDDRLAWAFGFGAGIMGGALWHVWTATCGLWCISPLDSRTFSSDYARIRATR